MAFRDIGISYFHFTCLSLIHVKRLIESLGIHTLDPIKELLIRRFKKVFSKEHFIVYNTEIAKLNNGNTVINTYL